MEYTKLERFLHFLRLIFGLLIAFQILRNLIKFLPTLLKVNVVHSAACT